MWPFKKKCNHTRIEFLGKFAQRRYPSGETFFFVYFCHDCQKEIKSQDFQTERGVEEAAKAFLRDRESRLKGDDE